MEKNDGFEMDMAEFKGKVIATLGIIQKDLQKIDKRFSDYSNKTDKRINGLEYWKTDLTAKMTLFVGIVTLGVNLGWDYIKNKLGIKQ